MRYQKTSSKAHDKYGKYSADEIYNQLKSYDDLHDKIKMLESKISQKKEVLSEQNDKLTDRKKMLDWLIFGDVKPASLTMLSTILNFDRSDDELKSKRIGFEPKTYDDFKSCIRFMRKFPKYRDFLLSVLPKKYPNWTVYTKNWSLIEATFDEVEVSKSFDEFDKILLQIKQ